MADLDLEARRAAHRRGFSAPMQERAQDERRFDSTELGSVNVGNFAPEGQELSDSNFEAALRAAIVAAQELCGSPEDGERGSVEVVIPAGIWDLSTITESIKVPGSYPTYSPSLVGEAPGSVVLVMPQNLYPWLELGTDDPGASPTLLNCVSNMTIKNIEFRATGGGASKGGIRCYASYRCTFEDVLVRGLGLIGTLPKWNENIAFDFNAVSGTNHQHLRMTRCVADYCVSGYRFGESTWSATLEDCHANGCMVAPALYEGGAVVTWRGGNTQCGPTNGTTMWYEDTEQAVHCSGAAYTTGLPSGTGAAFGVPSGQLTTVTGLSNMKGFARGDSTTHKGAWLEISDGRLYRIEEVISATSCTIRRAYGGSETGLAYQVRGCGGGSNICLNGIYHEGGAYALASFGPDYVSASKLTIEATEANNCDYVAEITGCQGEVRVHNTLAPGGYVGKIRHCESFLTDADVSTVDSDTYSLSGLVARKRGAVYDSRPRAKRYNRALVERGFIFAVDARKTSSIVKSGTDVTSWTDFIGGVVGARLNAGVAPQYVSSDANLGAPAIQLTGGASAAAVGGLEWNLAGKLRASRAGGTLIVVGRLPNTTVSGTNRLVVFRDNDLFVSTAWNDGIYIATGNYGLLYSSQLGGQSNSAALGAQDTNGQALLVSSYMRNTAGDAGSCGAGASDTTDYAVNSNFGCNGFAEALFTPSAPLVTAPWYVSGGTLGDLYVSHIAFADRAISPLEREELIDLIRNEFNVNKT